MDENKNEETQKVAKKNNTLRNVGIIGLLAAGGLAYGIYKSRTNYIDCAVTDFDDEDDCFEDEKDESSENSTEEE